MEKSDHFLEKSDHFDGSRFFNPCGIAAQPFTAVAVQAHLDLEASQSVAMHFGTFQLTTEGIDEPLRAREDACRAKNILPSRFRTLGFGDSLRLG